MLCICHRGNSPASIPRCAKNRVSQMRVPKQEKKSGVILRPLWQSTNMKCRAVCVTLKTLFPLEKSTAVVQYVFILLLTVLCQ